MAHRQRPAKWILEMLPKKCMNCGATSNLGYHHIVPVEYGGNDVPTNIAVLCSECHGRVHYGKDGVVDHGELVKLGMARAREKGMCFGRRGADAEKVMRLIAENSSQFVDVYADGAPLRTENEIMEMAGVHSVCYYKYKRRLMELLASDSWPYGWEKPTVRRRMPLYDRVIKKMRGDATA